MSDSLPGEEGTRCPVAAAALCLAPAAFGASFAPGSDGLGDPMFPLAGNGGYDVSNYALTLDYTPAGNRLVGTTVITARATQNLSRFDLDFRMQDSVSRVLVNGAPASYAAAQGQELVVTPESGLVSGKTFTVTVDYAGVPKVVTDPDQSIEGWVPTDDGAFVVNEPQGSPAWYPVDDNPTSRSTRSSRRGRCCRSCRTGSASTRRSTARIPSTPSARSSTAQRVSATRSRRRRS